MLNPSVTYNPNLPTRIVTFCSVTGDGPRIFACANDDLERSTEEKAAAVHFLRFELDAAGIAGVKTGNTVRMGIDHEALPYETDVAPQVAASLADDLKS